MVVVVVVVGMSMLVEPSATSSLGPRFISPAATRCASPGVRTRRFRMPRNNSTVVVAFGVLLVLLVLLVLSRWSLGPSWSLAVAAMTCRACARDATATSSATAEEKPRSHCESCSHTAERAVLSRRTCRWCSSSSWQQRPREPLPAGQYSSSNSFQLNVVRSRLLRSHRQKIRVESRSSTT